MKAEWKSISTCLLAGYFILLFTVILTFSPVAQTHEVNFLQANMGETEPTPDISTEEMRQIFEHDSAVIIDSRRREQFVAGYIPGAKNLDLPPGTTESEIASTVDRMLGGDRSAAVILYCNGPPCEASRVLGKQLVEAGFSSVKRYQLGIPIWRSLGGPTEVAAEGIARIYQVDNTAVLYDVRSREEYAKGSISGAHNVPAEENLMGILENNYRPRSDFNTRIIIFGRDGSQARVVAEAMGETAYHNVNFYSGTYDSLKTAIEAELRGRLLK